MQRSWIVSYEITFPVDIVSHQPRCRPHFPRRPFLEPWPKSGLADPNNRHISRIIKACLALLYHSPERTAEDASVQCTGVSTMYQRIGVRLVGSLIVDSIPVTLSYILQNSTQTVSIIVTGRLGPEELSAAAFSMMLAFVTG